MHVGGGGSGGGWGYRWVLMGVEAMVEGECLGGGGGGEGVCS